MARKLTLTVGEAVSYAREQGLEQSGGPTRVTEVVNGENDFKNEWGVPPVVPVARHEGPA